MIVPKKVSPEITVLNCGCPCPGLVRNQGLAMISHFQPLTVPPFFYDATPVIMLNLFEQRLPLLAPPRERGGRNYL